MYVWMTLTVKKPLVQHLIKPGKRGTAKPAEETKATCWKFLISFRELLCIACLTHVNIVPSSIGFNRSDISIRSELFPSVSWQ